MKSVLQRPVEFVDLRLAPTSELAALAELAQLEDHDQALQTLRRVARAVRSEDDERARVHALRHQTQPVSLPRRTAG